MSGCPVHSDAGLAQIPSCGESLRHGFQDDLLLPAQDQGVFPRLNDAGLNASLDDPEGSLYRHLRPGAVLRRPDAPQPDSQAHGLRRSGHHDPRRQQHGRQQQSYQTGSSSHGAKRLPLSLYHCFPSPGASAGEKRRSGSPDGLPPCAFTHLIFLSSALRCGGTCHTRWIRRIPCSPGDS